MLCRTERRLQGYKPVELSNTINALAKLGHMPSATWLDALTAAAAKSVSAVRVEYEAAKSSGTVPVKREGAKSVGTIPVKREGAESVGTIPVKREGKPSRWVRVKGEGAKSAGGA